MRSYATTFIASIAILVGSHAVLWAQDQDHSATRTRILALEHAWNQAEAFKDLKALDALFDNDMVYVDFDGTLMTKAAFLARVKSAHLEQVITESMAVQLFNTTAIVSGTYQSSEFKNGKKIERRGRFVDTWVYKDSMWICVAAQATPILQ
jgi:ketosteroid isomerase-like protein